ncbi:hypothetical protein AZE42_03064 [Rhizopogon vesiculosus]|uniref:Uncharacterized protein n=1 Tax=Rhizopogon vesiculosus TaxID=180088 RepID=A0A1J8PKI8_9AGAM|nr:hypothetical protein AZE42_03064 [Rhizopogon vesiculosus]
MPRRKRKTQVCIANLRKKRKTNDAQTTGQTSTRNEANKARVEPPSRTIHVPSAVQDVPASVQELRMDPCTPQHVRSALNHWFGNTEAGAKTHPAAVFFGGPLNSPDHDFNLTRSTAHQEKLSNDARQGKLWDIHAA